MTIHSTEGQVLYMQNESGLPVDGTTAGLDRVARVLVIFRNCWKKRFKNYTTGITNAFCFSERCESRVNIFPTLFWRAFLNWETNERQRNVASSLTRYESTVDGESACLLTYHQEVACDGRIVH